MKRIKVSLAILLFVTSSYSQEFIKFVPGHGKPQGINPCENDGFVIFYPDLVVKIDNDGQERNQFEYKGSGHGIVTPKSNIVFFSNNGIDSYLFMLDDSFNLIWYKEFNSLGIWFTDIITNDQSIVILGNKDGKTFIWKVLDSNLWTMANEYQYEYSGEMFVRQANDNSLLIIRELDTIRIHSYGQEDSPKTFYLGGYSESSYKPTDVVKVNDGIILIQETKIQKINYSGETVWRKGWDHYGALIDHNCGIRISDSKIIIGGHWYDYNEYHNKRRPTFWSQAFDNDISLINRYQTINDPNGFYKISYNPSVIVGGCLTGIAIFTNPFTPQITVVYPNDDNLVFEHEQTINILWTSNEVNTPVNIELYKDNTLNNVLISSTENDGYYNWTIPSNQTPGTDYKIKISSTSNSSISDFNDNDFTIQEPIQSSVMTVTNPSTSGIIWEKGKRYQFEWQYNGEDSPGFSIELYKAGMIIREFGTSSGANSLYWTIPADLEPGNDYKIKVGINNDTSVFDYSDNLFTINESEYSVIDPYDLDQNGAVDGLDVVPIIRSFGSTPGAAEWNPNADLVHDNIIDQRDLIATTKRYNSSPPANLNLNVNQSSSQIALEWESGGTSEGVDVEKKEGSNGTWGKVTTLSSTTTSYMTNDYVPSNTKYYYRVRTNDEFGNYRYSYEVSIGVEGPSKVIVSGRITTNNGIGIDNVVLTFSGGVGATITSGGGYYNQLVPYGWSGLIKPEYLYYTFVPVEREYTNLTTNNENQNFTAIIPPNPTISGIVKTDKEIRLPGVTLNFSGGQGPTTTNFYGYYSKEIVYGWSGTVTPNYSGFTFDPMKREYLNLETDKINQDYTAIPQSNITISGWVRREGCSGMKSVRLTFSNDGGETVTDMVGYYNHKIDYGWSGTITPEFGDYKFEPESKMITNVTDYVKQDFDVPDYWLAGDLWTKYRDDKSVIIDREIVMELVPFRDNFALSEYSYITALILGMKDIIGAIKAPSHLTWTFAAKAAAIYLIFYTIENMRSQWYWSISPDEYASPIITNMMTPILAPLIGQPYKINGIIREYSDKLFNLEITENSYEEINPKIFSELHTDGYKIPDNYSFIRTGEIASHLTIDPSMKYVHTLGVVNERWSDYSGIYVTLLNFKKSYTVQPVLIKMPPLKDPPRLASVISVYGTLVTNETSNPNLNGINTYLDATNGDFGIIKGEMLEFTENESFLKDAILIIGGSPVDIHVYDEQDRHIGAIYSGNNVSGEETEIPNSFYSFGKKDTDLEAILIYDPSSFDYNINIKGTGEGTYDSYILIINKKGEFIKESINLNSKITNNEWKQQKIHIEYSDSGSVADAEFPSAISGRTTIDNSSTPLPNITIQAKSDGEIKGTSKSNNEGFYTLQVQPGTYEVRAFSHEYGVKDSHTVEVTSLRETENINFIFESNLSSTMNFQEGWNLISFPLIMSSNSVADVLTPLSSSWSKLMTFNDGTWTQADASLPESFWTLKNIVPERGYWLSQSSLDTLTTSGTTQTSNIPLQKDWNLIGYPGMNSQSVTESLSGLNGKWQKLLFYEIGQWTQADASVPSSFWTLTQMQPGKGYWLQMSDTDILRFGDGSYQIAASTVPRSLPKSGATEGNVPSLSLSEGKTPIPPEFPSGYYGTVKINGKSAETGIKIFAIVSGCNKIFNTEIKGGSQYSLLSINGDDPVTEKKEGGIKDDEIRFYLEFSGRKIFANKAGNWKPGENQRIDLEIEDQNILAVDAEIPITFAISQNYPNPFNPTTNIIYQVPEKSHVVISIFNTRGQKINTLVEHEHGQGIFTTSWDGRDSNGEMVSSGVYFYRMKAANFTATQKLLLLR